jgi:hypothetical protein
MNRIQNLALVVGSIFFFLLAAEGLSQLMLYFFPNAALSYSSPRVIETGSSDFAIVPSPPPFIPFERKSRTPDARVFTNFPKYFSYKKPWIEPLGPGIYDAYGKLPTGETVFEVKYTINENLWRFTRPPLHAKKHLLLLGCSYIFGSGLNDYETLPSQIAKLSPDFHVYNWGFSGYSASSLLLRIRNTALRDQVHESKGIAAYYFIDSHINRVMGSMNVVGNWGDYLPNIEEGPKGEFVYKGSFLDSRPRLTKLYKFLVSRAFMRIFRIDIPRAKDSDLKFFVSMISEIRDELRKKTGTETFYFIFAPGSQNYREQLVPFLEAAHIHYLDYSHWSVDGLTGGKSTIPYDSHPTAEFNRKFAPHLVRDLKPAERINGSF